MNLAGHAVCRAGRRILSPGEIVEGRSGEMNAPNRFDEIGPYLSELAEGKRKTFATESERFLLPPLVYDALLAWLEQAPDETHLWNPQGGAPMAIA